MHLDELTEAVGARLAALTGAEWGLVSNGCSAGLTLATAACVAGGNPDLHVRLPNLTGFPKDEAIIPTHSRNVYDAALRSVGVRVVEVSTLAEFEAALGPRAAMIYILAGPNADNSPLNVKAIAPIAKAKGVPIVVDAAAEILTIPNVHLQNGATLVAYSGGKCLRGPQTAGMLLGRKDLVRAAWVHSAPHHGVTRSLKVGKEDAIGMLMAVEMWVKRDHEAEWCPDGPRVAGGAVWSAVSFAALLLLAGWRWTRPPRPSPRPRGRPRIRAKGSGVRRCSSVARRR